MEVLFLEEFEEKVIHFTRNMRLKTPQDVRKMLARVINLLLQSEELTLDTAKTVGSLSNSLMKSMELSDLSERMERIERLIESQESADIKKRG